MKHAPSLDDLELFALVGQAGGLAPVSRQRGVSVPTLSRRMRALEGQLGWQLFERGPQGYRLTARGRALLDETEGLRAEARRVRQLAAEPAPVEVRITAGSWTSAYLAAQLPRFWQVQAGWRPSFLEASARLDIARRGADIGIRNQRPQQSWLAGRRTARISYAEYALSDSVQGYVALREGALETPSSAWVRAQHGEDITVTASTPRMLADLACAGAGRVVLPRFAALLFPVLQQVSPEIGALAHEEWLVSHHEARHDPPLRAALDSLAAVLTDPDLRRGLVAPD